MAVLLLGCGGQPPPFSVQDGSAGGAYSVGGTYSASATGGALVVSTGGTSTTGSSGGTSNATGASCCASGGTNAILDGSGGASAAENSGAATGGTYATGGTEFAAGTANGGRSGGGGSESGGIDAAGGAGGSEVVRTDAGGGVGGSEVVRTDAGGGVGGSEVVRTDAGGGAGGSEVVRTDAAAGSGATGASVATGGTESAGGSGLAGLGGDGSGGQSGIDPEPLVFVIEPTLEPNDNESAPLAARLTVETNVPTTGSVLVSGGGESWMVELDSGSIHEEPLLGFLPDTEYTFTVTVDAGDTQISANPLTWHTPRLPDDFPHLAFVRSDPYRMAPGMTMFDVIVERYLVVVDNLGQVRWYFRAPLTNARYRLLADGNIICLSSRGPYLTEIDWFGNPVNTWYAANTGAVPVGAIPVAVNRFHHNLDEMPNGNLLVLTEDFRMISGYPTSSDDPAAPTKRVRVMGDQLVEFTRKGEVVKRYSLFDILDPVRIGHDGESGDWSHSNAIVYDVASDAYLVSMRHQDAVIKIRRDTGDLVWILGNHANWRQPWRSTLLMPLGDDFEWQYHQHAVEVSPGGVIVYDNGNYRAPAYEQPRVPYYSRAVRFAIDEQAMTVEQAWSYQPHVDNVPLFSYAMSDADLLVNGNVLVASGTLTNERARRGWSQIVEVTDGGESVFELNVLDSPDDLTTFDADRIPDIRYLTALRGGD